MCAMQLGVEFSDGNVSDVAAAQVQKDVLQIQKNSGIQHSDLDADCVLTDAFQVNLTNDNRTQKRRVHSVDGGDEALLASEPRDPEANAVGDRNWRKQDRSERHDDDHQNNKKNSILKPHRCETKK